MRVDKKLTSSRETVTTPSKLSRFSPLKKAKVYQHSHLRLPPNILRTLSKSPVTITLDAAYGLQDSPSVAYIRSLLSLHVAYHSNVTSYSAADMAVENQELECPKFELEIIPALVPS